jgi:hypothetical protein
LDSVHECPVYCLRRAGCKILTPNPLRHELARRDL